MIGIAVLHRNSARIIYKIPLLKAPNLINNNMRSVTTCILCILGTFIAFFAAVSPSPQPSSVPTLPKPLNPVRALVVISTDLFGLMANSPFTAVGLYSVDGNKTSHMVFIPSWKDIEYELGLTGYQRKYYIFRKVKAALSHDSIWQVRIVPLASSSNSKA